MGIVRPVMKEYPYAWAFFVPFIMTTTFATVNLFVGLVVNSLQEAAQEDSEEKSDAFRDEVLERLRRIEGRLPAAEGKPDAVDAEAGAGAEAVEAAARAVPAGQDDAAVKSRASTHALPGRP